jgi:hypothetical protein
MLPVAECNESKEGDDTEQGAYFAAAKKKAPSLRDILHWLRCGRSFVCARAWEGDAASARTSRPRPRRRALPAPYFVFQAVRPPLTFGFPLNISPLDLS